MRKFTVTLDLADETITEFASWLGKPQDTIQEPIDFIATRYWNTFMTDVATFQKYKAEQMTKSLVEAAVADAQQKITFAVEDTETLAPDLSGDNITDTPSISA